MKKLLALVLLLAVGLAAPASAQLGFTPLREIQSVYKDGGFHFIKGERRDNIGDFQIGVAVVDGVRYYVMMARMGTPPPGGAFWWAPYGDPYSGWTQGHPPGSAPSPIKSLPMPKGAANIDTHAWVQNPLTGVFTWLHSVRDARTGLYHLERATSAKLRPNPGFYKRLGTIGSDRSEECSIVIDPWFRVSFMFYVRKTSEAPDAFGVRFRSRVYRRAISMARGEFDTNPYVGKEIMVFEPSQDGQGLWGTANTILQPSVTILPDGSYLMVALGKTPIRTYNGKPAVGRMNNTTAVGMWRSVDLGRTWKPVAGNPVLSRQFLGLVPGFANQVNSPHAWYDPWKRKLYVSMQIHRGGTVNEVGSRLATCELQL